MVVYLRVKTAYLLFASFVLFILLWFYKRQNDLRLKSAFRYKNGRLLVNFDYGNYCFNRNTNGNRNLEDINDYLDEFKASKNQYCNEIYLRFMDMFEVELLYGQIVVNGEFKEKIKKWLNNDAEAVNSIEKQKIIKVYNKYMHEEMIYNSVRGKRPQAKEAVSEKTYSEQLLKDSVNGCDFCGKSYEKNTASDIFGRIETELTYTAANTFKYDKWHSLIVSRNHDTLNLNAAETVDMFNVALMWYRKVNTIDETAVYPQMIWDAMPKSGASQVHTHLQTSMGIQSYYGVIRRLQSAAQSYYETHERDYFYDFILLHQALGLAIGFNQTYVILNLVPIKDFEVMIIQTSESVDESLFTIIHHTIRAFVDVLEKYSFSLGMYLPEFKRTTKDSNNHLPYTICRITFRSPASNLRSDMNGLDLYTSSVLGTDRYKIAKTLFEILKLKIKL